MAIFIMSIIKQNKKTALILIPVNPNDLKILGPSNTEWEKNENHCLTTSPFSFSRGWNNNNSKQQEFFYSSDFGSAGMGTDCNHRIFPLFPIWMGDVCDCLLLASHPLPLHRQPGQWKNPTHALDYSGWCTSIQLILLYKAGIKLKRIVCDNSSTFWFRKKKQTKLSQLSFQWL